MYRGVDIVERTCLTMDVLMLLHPGVGSLLGSRLAWSPLPLYQQQLASPWGAGEGQHLSPGHFSPPLASTSLIFFCQTRRSLGCLGRESKKKKKVHLTCNDPIATLIRRLVLWLGGDARSTTPVNCLPLFSFFALQLELAESQRRLSSFPDSDGWQQRGPWTLYLFPLCFLGRRGDKLKTE